MKNLNVPNLGKVPKLRFPEFSEDWEQSTIGECCNDLEYGMNVAAKEFDGVNKYIRITDIDEKSSTYKADDIVSPEGNLEDKYIVRENDILFARTGASTGKTYIYNSNDGVLYFAGFLIRANVKTHNDSKFIYQQTKLSRYNKWVNIMSARSGQPGINSQEYSTYKLFLPTIEEQHKVSGFINLLDQRIATQNKIIQQLQSLIKGIVVSVTAETPNTRIDVCLVCHSSTLQENQIDEFGGFPVYGANGICGYTDNADFNEPAILIVKDGSGVGNVRYVSGQYSAIGTQNILTSQNGYCLKFIYFCLQAFNFIPYKTGMAIPHIYFKDYGKAKIYCPNYAKQIEIAKQIENIEKKIEIETSLLNKYEEQKKFLLSNMFI